MANGNPYYIQPGINLQPGLQGLGQSLMQFQQMRQLQKEKQQQQKRSAAIDAIYKGLANPEEIPALANEMGAPQIAESYSQDPEGTILKLKRLAAGLDPVRYRNYMTGIEGAGSGGGGVPAEMKFFEYLIEGLPEEEKVKARRIKAGLDPRATEAAEQKAMKQFATETAKLQARLGFEPQVAAAVTAAKNQASQEVKQAGKVKDNQTAWNVYNNAMNNLATAMKGTSTGPVVGFIPAVTSNQQIAKGAVAVMAPVLKQMFRASGEGIFTDKDQELLMGMVPTRKDTPEARVAKIKAIDMVVRAKLRMDAQGQPGAPSGKYKDTPTEDIKNQLKDFGFNF